MAARSNYMTDQGWREYTENLHPDMSIHDHVYTHTRAHTHTVLHTQREMWRISRLFFFTGDESKIMYPTELCPVTNKQNGTRIIIYCWQRLSFQHLEITLGKTASLTLSAMSSSFITPIPASKKTRLSTPATQTGSRMKSEFAARLKRGFVRNRNRLPA